MKLIRMVHESQTEESSAQVTQHIVMQITSVPKLWGSLLEINLALCHIFSLVRCILSKQLILTVKEKTDTS